MAKPKAVTHQDDVVTEIKTNDANEITGATIDGTEVVIEEVQAVPDCSDEKTMMSLGADKLIVMYGSKSKAIRALAALGHKCGPISRALNIRFQHARNVLDKPLKRVIKEERAAAQVAAQAD